MLVSLWKFLSLFPKCEVLFDSEAEIGGIYDPEAIDPEVARPASASLWELQFLRDHESPLVSLSRGTDNYSFLHSPRYLLDNE